MNQVLCFDPSSNQWNEKANMPTARDGGRLVWFENRIWVIGGRDDGSDAINKVESYDPSSNSWQSEASLPTARIWPVAWVANDRIYVGGGTNGSYLSSIDVFDPSTNKWSSAGNFPENKDHADAVVLNDRVCSSWKKRLKRLFQQSLRRRPECLRGGLLRLVSQGRQCLRGYAPRAGGSGRWIGYCE